VLGEGMDETYEMEELKEDIKQLVEQLYNMVSPQEQAAAKSYWYPHIMMALDSDHQWLGGSMTTVQDTIDAMRDPGNDPDYEGDEDDGRPSGRSGPRGDYR
jgi:hypothetical protein